MSELIKLNLNAQEVPGVVPPIVMTLQSKLPGKELVRDIYFHLTYSNNLGWKHSCVKPIETLSKYNKVNSDLSFITITKNPYSWLLSMYRRPYHQYFSDKLSFEMFLQHPWKTVGRDNINKVLRNPVELWNIKNKSYLQLKGQSALNITSENIIRDPEAIIEQISRQFSIEKLSDEFNNYESSTKKDKGKDNNYYRDYYLNEKWRDELTCDEIAFINEFVDKELMSQFGYRVL